MASQRGGSGNPAHLDKIVVALPSLDGSSRRSMIPLCRIRCPGVETAKPWSYSVARLEELVFPDAAGRGSHTKFSLGTESTPQAFGTFKDDGELTTALSKLSLTWSDHEERHIVLGIVEAPLGSIETPAPHRRTPPASSPNALVLSPQDSTSSDDDPIITGSRVIESNAESSGKSVSIGEGEQVEEIGSIMSILRGRNWLLPAHVRSLCRMFGIPMPAFRNPEQLKHRLPGTKIPLRLVQLTAIYRQVILAGRHPRLAGHCVADGTGVGKTITLLGQVALNRLLSLNAADIKQHPGKHLHMSQNPGPGSMLACPRGIVGHECLCMPGNPLLVWHKSLSHGPVVLILPAAIRSRWGDEIGKYMNHTIDEPSGYIFNGKRMVDPHMVEGQGLRPIPSSQGDRPPSWAPVTPHHITADVKLFPGDTIAEVRGPVANGRPFSAVTKRTPYSLDAILRNQHTPSSTIFPSAPKPNYTPKPASETVQSRSVVVVVSSAKLAQSYAADNGNGLFLSPAQYQSPPNPTTSMCIIKTVDFNWALSPSMIAIDESHRVMSSNAKLFQWLRDVCHRTDAGVSPRPRVIALSATPISKGASDIMSLYGLCQRDKGEVEDMKNLTRSADTSVAKFQTFNAAPLVGKLTLFITARGDGSPYLSGEKLRLPRPELTIVSVPFQTPDQYTEDALRLDSAMRSALLEEERPDSQAGLQPGEAVRRLQFHRDTNRIFVGAQLPSLAEALISHEELADCGARFICDEVRAVGRSEDAPDGPRSSKLLPLVETLDRYDDMMKTLTLVVREASRGIVYSQSVERDSNARHVLIFASLPFIAGAIYMFGLQRWSEFADMNIIIQNVPTSMNRRDELINRLSTQAALDPGEGSNRRKCIVLVSTFGLLGEGLDGLTFFSIGVKIGEPWTPAVTEQAIGRLHREGGDKKVYFFDLYREDRPSVTLLRQRNLRRLEAFLAPGQ